MAQVTVLALGTTQATSSDIVVPAGASYAVGLFANTAQILPGGVDLDIVIDSPGADTVIGTLTSISDGLPAVSVTGPGTFRVVRPAYDGTPVGVFVENGL